MNVGIERENSNQGSAFALTINELPYYQALMGSYLYMVQGQRQAVARSQNFNQAKVVAGAVVDEPVTLMNRGVVAGDSAIFPWKDATGGNETHITNRPVPSPVHG